MFFQVTFRQQSFIFKLFIAFSLPRLFLVINVYLSLVILISFQLITLFVHHSFIHELIHLVILSSIHSFILSFILSFIHSLNNLVNLSIMHLFIHFSTHSFILSFICSFYLADEWTEWFNPPDYDRDQYDEIERNPKLEGTSMIKCVKKPSEAPDCTNGCLFNMRQDPCEYHDLSQEKNEMFEKLKSKLEDYKKEMVPPRYKHDEDPNANPRNHGGIWTPWVDVEGEPVEHKPLPPGKKIPGQDEPKLGGGGEEGGGEGAQDNANQPAQDAPTQQPTPKPQQAPSQEAMKVQLMQPMGYTSSRNKKNAHKVLSAVLVIIIITLIIKS